MARALIAAVLVAGAGLGGCGGDEPRRPATVTVPERALEAAPLPGRQIPIGGGRSLFVTCVGAGKPTVLLEGGGAGHAAQWHDVQPQLGRSTRVCAYDRAGAGQSPPTPGLRDARDELSDLRRLLAHAPIDAPIVLVGHSYGGVLARVFAHQNATRTAGLVLIDTMGRDGRRRQLAIWPESQAPEVRALLATTVLQNIDLAVGESLARRVKTTRHMPLAVIDAARQSVLDPVPPRLRRRLNETWARMHDELAGLSDDSVRVTALRSDHDVASARDGQPSVVIDAVRAVVRAVRDGARLPPCSEIFSGPDVRCRS